MVRYSRFLLRNIVVKKGIYALVLLFATLMIIVVEMQADVANRNNLPFIDSISTFTKFYPFIFSTLFTTLIIIYVFKNGEDDGSELLIISKPIRRWEILVSKFLITLGFVIAFQSFAFFVYLAAGAFDTICTNKQLFDFAGSLAVGGFIIQLMMICIVSLIAALANKVGTLIFGVMLASIAPIISFILAPVGKGIPFGVKFLDDRILINSSQLQAADSPSADSSFTMDDARRIVDYKSIYNVRGEESPERLKYESKIYDTYKDQQWYRKAAYLDLWYQWGGFMSMFIPQDNVKGDHIQDWTRSYADVDYGDKAWDIEMLDANGVKHNEKVAFYLSVKQLGLDELVGEEHKDGSSHENIISKTVNDLNGALRTLFLNRFIIDHAPAANEPVPVPLNTSTVQYKTDTTGKQVLDQLGRPIVKETDQQVAARILDSLSFMMKEKSLASKIELAGRSMALPLIAEIRLFQEFKKYLDQKTLEGKHMYIYQDGRWLDYQTPTSLMEPMAKDGPWIVHANQKLAIYKSKPFIETKYIVYVWSSVMALLLAATVITYMKRDFK